MASSGGSRSRNGCYTCRIRKKKCDEQLPRCGNCQTGSLQCYGYDVPPPDWMQGKRGWKEIMATEEAQKLRSVAEMQYKARRRHNGQNRLDHKGKAGGIWSSVDQPISGELIMRDKRLSLMPESIWWDAGFCTLLPITSHKPPKEDARLLKLYLDFVFPIQFTFYPMSTSADQSWLIGGLYNNKARYHAAMSISASFDASIREAPGKIDGIGLSLEVAERQALATRDLQKVIEHFSDRRGLASSPREILRIGLQILEVMVQLLSLEVFTRLEGAWELHHQATMSLLNTIHSCNMPEPWNQDDTQVETRTPSPLESVLDDCLSSPDDQFCRTFQFHVIGVAWVDIIANATFGIQAARTSKQSKSQKFDYIPYLHNDTLQIQDIMGCHSSVMANIAEISALEANWKIMNSTSSSSADQELHHQAAAERRIKTGIQDDEELSARAAFLENYLAAQVQQLEQSIPDKPSTTTSSAENINLITLTFAYAAIAYLQVVISDSSGGDSPNLVLIHNVVNRGLEILEMLSPTLIIRTNWALAVLGCMADESLYDRFRGPVRKLAAQGMPLGMLWKGLLVMEECWRLRREKPELVRGTGCGWRAGVESLGARILLV